MEYVIAVVVLVLAVAGILTLTVVRATRGNGAAPDRAPDDRRAPERLEPERPASERLADRET